MMDCGDGGASRRAIEEEEDGAEEGTGAGGVGWSERRRKSL